MTFYKYEIKPYKDGYVIKRTLFGLLPEFWRHKSRYDARGDWYKPLAIPYYGIEQFLFDTVEDAQEVIAIVKGEI